MNKLNIPQPEEEVKALNIVDMPMEDPQEEAACLVCGNQYYEWGHTEGIMLEHYKPGVPTGLLAGKDYIRVRRCKCCNNLQLFHARPASLSGVKVGT